MTRARRAPPHTWSAKLGPVREAPPVSARSSPVVHEAPVIARHAPHVTRPSHELAHDRVREQPRALRDAQAIAVAFETPALN